MALSQFVPIEALIDKVHGLQAVATTDFAVAKTAVTRLSQWVGEQIDEFVEAGWQTVDRLLNPAEVGLAFRTVGVIEPPVVDVSRAKLVNLGIQFGASVRVALVMRLTQVAASAEDATAADAYCFAGSSFAGVGLFARRVVALRIR